MPAISARGLVRSAATATRCSAHDLGVAMGGIFKRAGEIQKILRSLTQIKKDSSLNASTAS
jgi:hypothetical protein